MPRSPLSSLLRYALAPVTVGLAIGLHQLMTLWLGPLPPYLLLYPAVMFTAWAAGRRPGLLSIVISAAAAAYWLLPPQHTLAVSQRSDQVSLVAFVLLSLAMWAIVDALRRERDRSEMRQRELERETAARLHTEAELREANRRKDEFLASLAHELRNPLAPIRSGLDLLALERADATARARALIMMQRQLGHMVRLVDDLLDVSRITRGQPQLRLRRIVLQDVLQAALESSRPVLGAADHHVEVQLAPQPLHVEGDETRLIQVFCNLLNNAAKYTPAGGHVCLALRRDGREAVVQVQDDGMGLPADQLDHVFGLFVQLAPSLERQGGLGIGLTLVRQLVGMHGGQVRAESAGPGRGSTFTVRLPLSETEREPAPAPPVAAEL